MSLFDIFRLKNTLSVVFLPPLAPLILIAAGLILLQWRPRSGKVLAWSGLALGVALITPGAVDGLLDGLEIHPSPSAAALARTQAIVILGGGIRDHAPEFGGETVNRLTLERLRYGARLARQSHLPVLVTGGAPSGASAAEGTLMKAALQEDFGVPVRWTETRSRDTRENAELSAAILLPAGVRRIALVSHAAHLRRAVEAFERAGFEVTPAPTAFFLDRSPPHEGAAPALPSMNAAYAGWYAAHEWVGLLFYRLRP